MDYFKIIMFVSLSILIVLLIYLIIFGVSQEYEEQNVKGVKCYDEKDVLMVSYNTRFGPSENVPSYIKEKIKYCILEELSGK